ncbi:MAG TPA: arginine deiminase-related protein [Bacteroidales bacterium]|nr:arginine deiminase-related protein [Bacteroidales bacterium]HPK29914.1 arginine deiminase-related protein [Bacteroidales bacterium]
MSGISFRQTANRVLMVRPCSFGFNVQTASNNAFQRSGFESGAQEAALREFDTFVALLRSHGITVDVIEDTPEPHTPDSIFPNNWFSTHSDGTLVLYPMFAPNRRLERKQSVMDHLIGTFDIRNIYDLTPYESKEKYFEGTGSMVIDREAGIVYACRSPRTDEDVLKEFCKLFDWDYFLFDAMDASGKAIYHTNVMMCVGTDLAVVCLESIRDLRVREDFLRLLGKKDIVDISLEQMGSFAGNMLELQPFGERKPLLVMSSSARKSLRQEQLRMIESHCDIASPDLRIIEANGGGSARCMLAEIFYEEF